MIGMVTTDPSQVVPLNLLQAGQYACISQVVGVSDEVHRFNEMGLRGGAQIQMVQPGQSCIVRVNGHKLCFRTDEGTCILVCPLSSASRPR